VAAREQVLKGEAELVIATKYQRPVRSLEGNLTEIHVFRMGEKKIIVYVVGRSEEGNWMGFLHSSGRDLT
jgi:hypothetical protein